ncbi:MAG TPA: hypothetical protein VHC71_15935 [Hyphomicrobium sp.]|nr:hypothetical protein [Hyphomicrobium sp.]
MCQQLHGVADASLADEFAERRRREGDQRAAELCFAHAVDAAGEPLRRKRQRLVVFTAFLDPTERRRLILGGILVCPLRVDALIDVVLTQPIYSSSWYDKRRRTIAGRLVATLDIITSLGPRREYGD